MAMNYARAEKDCWCGVKLECRSLMRRRRHDSISLLLYIRLQMQSASIVNFNVSLTSPINYIILLFTFWFYRPKKRVSPRSFKVTPVPARDR